MDELVLASTSFPEQCHHTLHVLGHERDPPVPFEMIARLFSVDRNPGVSLIMGDHHVIRSNVTPRTARCLLKPVTRDKLLGLAEEDEDEQELNVQE
jgi:hypothetical protein